MVVEPSTLHRESRHIIGALDEIGEASTADLRERTGIDNESINNRFHHELEPKGLVEVDGHVQTGRGGSEAKVLKLTGLGTAVAEEIPAMDEETRAELLWQETKDALNKRDAEDQRLHNRIDDIDKRLTRIEDLLSEMATLSPGDE